MTVILDTHAWIWYLNADPKLGPDARSATKAAIQQDGAVPSAILLWEISMLVARGRPMVPHDPRDWLGFHLSRPDHSVHPQSIAIASPSRQRVTWTRCW